MILALPTIVTGSLGFFVSMIGIGVFSIATTLSILGVGETLTIIGSAISLLVVSSGTFWFGEVELIGSMQPAVIDTNVTSAISRTV